MTFDQQKREAIAAAKHLVEILGEVHDESPVTTKYRRTMTFNERKREAIAATKHLVEILGEVHDESPVTTQHERQWLCDTLNRIKAASVEVLSILDSQDNPE